MWWQIRLRCYHPCLSFLLGAAVVGSNPACGSFFQNIHGPCKNNNDMQTWPWKTEQFTIKCKDNIHCKTHTHRCMHTHTHTHTGACTHTHLIGCCLKKKKHSLATGRYQMRRPVMKVVLLPGDKHRLGTHAHTLTHSHKYTHTHTRAHAHASAYLGRFIRRKHLGVARTSRFGGWSGLVRRYWFLLDNRCHKQKQCWWKEIFWTKAYRHNAMKKPWRSPGSSPGSNPRHQIA